MDADFKSASPHMDASIRDMVDSLIAMVANVADAAKGEAMLGDLVEAGFLSRFGPQMRALEIEVEYIEDQQARCKEEEAALRQTEMDTPRYIQTWEQNQTRLDQASAEAPVARWQFRHKVEGGTICLTIIALVVGSSVTAYANLTGTGLPIFIEIPVLPLSMSVLPAVIGVAVKTVGSSIEAPKGHRRFVRALYAATGLSVAAWITLFADQFHGMGASIGLFDEAPAWKEKAMVAAQLTAEVLLGTSLSYRLERIAARYAPDHFFENPEHKTLSEEREASARELEQLTARLADVKGRLSAFHAAMRLQTETAVIAYLERRQRFDRKPNSANQEDV